MLTVDNISKSFGRRLALDQVSFTLKENEIVGLVGPNGAGKTTIMKIIVGLIKNYKGSVSIRDKYPWKERGVDKAVGSMIETPYFYPYMSGMQNLRYFSQLSGIIDMDGILDIIQLLGLEKVINKPVKAYSMGMKQRLGIAQALLNRPGMLVLDEPTSGLDPDGMHEIRNYLKRIADENQMTILISSHILTEIQRICDRVLILQRGQLVKEIKLTDRLGQGQGRRYIIKTNSPQRLKAYFDETGMDVEGITEGAVSINLYQQEISEVLKVALNQNIKILAVNESIDDLEDQYFRLVEGNVIE